MNWNRLVRQTHRWLSLIFTIAVVANIIAVAVGRTIEWLYMLPLVPLLLMLPSGLYMFFQPYVLGRRDRRRPGAGEARL